MVGTLNSLVLINGQALMTSEIRAAATVVIVRNTDKGIKTLLLRRHSQLKVSGGHWVFPGGSIDPEDYPGTDDEEQAARRAAVRETQEESGLHFHYQELQLIAHWTTPPSMGRRFATWFYLVEGGDAPVCVDGEEMDDYCWDYPEVFLSNHRRGELALLPPTVVALTELSACATVAQTKNFYQRRDVPYIEPHITSKDDCICMLYEGDAGYSLSDSELVGPRNRCYLEGKVWRYEFDAG
ncbi:MAG: 8-oxo-dGTP pyrophosphatase MutT (NUDIX family) [Zhongshania sp.]